MKPAQKGSWSPCTWLSSLYSPLSWSLVWKSSKHFIHLTKKCWFSNHVRLPYMGIIGSDLLLPSIVFSQQGYITNNHCHFRWFECLENIVVFITFITFFHIKTNKSFGFCCMNMINIVKYSIQKKITLKWFYLKTIVKFHMIRKSAYFSICQALPGS